MNRSDIKPGTEYLRSPSPLFWATYGLNLHGTYRVRVDDAETRYNLSLPATGVSLNPAEVSLSPAGKYLKAVRIHEDGAESVTYVRPRDLVAEWGEALRRIEAQAHRREELDLGKWSQREASARWWA